MPIDIRCTCGALWRVEADAATARLTCADCGRDLPWPSAAGNVPVVNLAPYSPALPVETVAVAPYYQPDAPAKAQPFVYDVIESARTESEPRRSSSPSRFRPIDGQRYEPYDAHSEFEEQELRRLVGAARCEMWRYGLRRTRPLDKNVWDCFLFAGKAWWVILILGFGWLVLTPTILLALPTPQSLGIDLLLPRIFAITVLLVCLAATWTFLRDVCGMGADGKRELKFQLLFDLRSLAQSALMAVVALLAGPIVLVAAMVWFWIYSGPLDWLDWLILAQLGLSTGVAWVYLLLAADVKARLRDIHAAAIVRLVRSQGWPGWVFPLVGGVSVTLFAFALVQLVALMLENPLAAVMLQFLLWLAALYFWTGLMRWYGITRYWRRAQNPAAA